MMARSLRGDRQGVGAGSSTGPVVSPTDVVRWIPVFRELLDRDDVNHTDALVYGAIHALQQEGVKPTRLKIGEILQWSCTSESTLRRAGLALASLERKGLLSRHREAPNRTRYTLTGPGT